MTRERLISEMTNTEFVYWTRFHARRKQAEEMAQMGAP